MRLLPSDLAIQDPFDLFLETSGSASIEWREGSALIRPGARSGVGLRRGSRPGKVFFRSLDDPSPDRIAEAVRDLRARGDEPQVAPPAAMGMAIEAGREHSMPLGGEGDAALGWPGWEAEIAAVLRYVEDAAAGIHGEASACETAAEAHLFRQSVHHETAASAANDERSGVRIELRASLGEGPPLVRRVAGRDVAHLAAREPPKDLGAALGRALLIRRHETACPDGTFPVVFAAGTCGALVHEVGHLLEEDHVRLPGPVFVRGERIAPEIVTIVDDPTACYGRGSYGIDDEGVPPRAKVLVGGGIFMDTLQTAGFGAGRESSSGTGHGRRASYRDLPLPRMGCTFLAAGEADPESIVSSTQRGVFASSLRSGDADPGSGMITLIVDEGFLIEGGKLTRPLGQCVIAARARDLLGSIDFVGSDLRFDHGTRDCVKSNQAVTVIVGLPTVRARVVRLIVP